ncbi:MAG: hypothetical protein V5A84_03055 [Planctomycetota bacterium]
MECRGIGLLEGEPRGDFPRQRWKPARVPRVLHPSLWIKNSSLRYEDPVESVLHTPSRLHSKGTWTEEKARNTEGANWAEVEWFAADPYLPIILAYRPVNETIGPILSAPWKPVKKDTYRGHSCVVVRGTSFPDISRAPYYRVWLAKDRDYLPVRYEVRNESAEVKEQGNMDYIRRNGEWVLDGWVRRVPAPIPGMKWRTARKATSLEITFNSPIKDKRFLDIDSEE